MYSVNKFNLLFNLKIMKKLTFLAIFAIATFASFSQDFIIKKNGEEIKAVISEVGQTEVKYKKYDLDKGPIFTILKSDIFMIRYQNGSKDVFNEPTASKESEKKSSVDIIADAKADAKRNYKGKKSGAGWTTATSIVLSPVLGVVPAAICASNEPSDDNLRAPNPELMKNNEYRNAYTEEAHKIKRRKVWTGLGIGSGVWLVLILLL